MTNNIPKSNNIYINKFNKLLEFYFTSYVALGESTVFACELCWADWDTSYLEMNFDMLMTLLILNSPENQKYTYKLFDPDFIENNIRLECIAYKNKNKLTEEQLEMDIRDDFRMNKPEISEFNKKIEDALKSDFDPEFDFSNFFEYYKENSNYKSKRPIKTNISKMSLCKGIYRLKVIRFMGNFNLEDVNKFNIDLDNYLRNNGWKGISNSSKVCAGREIWGMIVLFTDLKTNRSVRPTSTSYYIQYLE